MPTESAKPWKRIVAAEPGPSLTVLPSASNARAATAKGFPAGVRRAAGLGIAAHPEEDRVLRRALRARVGVSAADAVVDPEVGIAREGRREVDVEGLAAHDHRIDRGIAHHLEITGRHGIEVLRR